MNDDNYSITDEETRYLEWCDDEYTRKRDDEVLEKYLKEEK